MTSKNTMGTEFCKLRVDEDWQRQRVLCLDTVTFIDKDNKHIYLFFTSLHYERIKNSVFLTM